MPQPTVGLAAEKVQGQEAPAPQDKVDEASTKAAEVRFELEVAQLTNLISETQSVEELATLAAKLVEASKDSAAYRKQQPAAAAAEGTKHRQRLRGSKSEELGDKALSQKGHRRAQHIKVVHEDI